MSAQIKTVDPTILAGWIAAEEVVVVDVREPDEHRAGHIPGSILLPLSRFDPAKVPVQPGKRLLFHCQLGRRCGPASERMAAAGLSGEIFRLAGGFLAWTQAGGAVATGD